MAVLDEISKTSEEEGKLVVNLLSGESCKTDEKCYDSDVNQRQRIKSKTKWIIIGAIGIVLIVSLAISFPVYVLYDKEKDIPVRCNPNLKIPNGIIINRTESFLQGDEISIECNDGYIRNGSSVIACMSSAHWNETPICIRKQCQKLQPPSNSDIKLSHLVSNIDEIIVSCHQGYRLEGRATVVCQDDETWSPVPLCKPVDCGRPEDIRNGGIYKLTKTTYNFTFEVQCGHGYDLKENSQVRCNSDGQWSASPKCEPVLCGPPILPTYAFPENMGGEYVFGKTVSFQCVKGFSIEGAKWATCQGDGKWSDLPKCVQTKEYPVRKGHNSVNTQASSSSRLHSDIGLIKCIFVSVTLILNYLYSKI